MLRDFEGHALELSEMGQPKFSIHVANNVDGKNEPPPQLVAGTIDEYINEQGEFLQDMVSFWDGYRQHFAAFGVNVCPVRERQYWGLPSLLTATAPLPFAFHCDHSTMEGPFIVSRHWRSFNGRFGFAQDTSGRDLFIKLVDKGSMEYNIYKTLGESNSLYDSRECAGVLPPTAILDSPYQFAFVVMPMWGMRVRPDEFDTLRQVTTFIQGTLSGLSILHRHRIAHRDIDLSNIAINCHSPAVMYALFDFDMSLQLPPDTSLKSCWRPADEAFTGKKLYHAPDVYEGERHYNPFAFDVACLARLYLAHFKDVIPVFPVLAPLIGKMSTHVIEERWSAEEALAFFNETLAGLSPDVLDSSVTLQFDLDPLDDPDRYWNQLSADLQCMWKMYRPPPLSWTSRVLRWVNYLTDVGWEVVPRIRRWLHI